MQSTDDGIVVALGLEIVVERVKVDELALLCPISRAVLVDTRRLQPGHSEGVQLLLPLFPPRLLLQSGLLLLLHFVHLLLCSVSQGFGLEG